jgi:hypothetical protein
MAALVPAAGEHPGRGECPTAALRSPDRAPPTSPPTSPPSTRIASGQSKLIGFSGGAFAASASPSAQIYHSIVAHGTADEAANPSAPRRRSIVAEPPCGGAAIHHPTG